MISKNRRCELEIINELLVLAKRDINKTRLIYQTNLSYNHFIKYMDFLIKRGFLGVKPGNPIGRMYYITDKGKKFVEEFKNVLDLME